MKLKNLIYILLISIFAIPAYAVSDKDMEQAKVIAAKLYLRWANNGSGYLDEVKASSMSDLESKLKTQEKENLKAFKSVNIPADYASWDKERFVQFWGSTFFTSPALNADGKRAKDRVKKAVSDIKVSAPTTAKADEPKAEEPKPEEKKEKEETPAAEPQNQDGGITIPEPTEVVAQQEEIVSDSLSMIQAEEQSMAMGEHAQKPKTHTWIYVIVLIVLVILVVWLMVYAANMMKKQGKEVRSIEGNDKKISKELTALEVDNNKLRSEVEQLKDALAEAKNEIKRLKSSANAEPKPRNEESKSIVESLAASVAAPVKAPAKASAKSKEEPKIITEIFLGRANPKGFFVRGDRRPNPAHTVFRLDTKDGIVGTFRFVGTPEAIDLVTSNPLQYLAGGCVSDNFEDAESADSIVTEAPGTAILENGCWKVLRKSKIRFE